MTKTKRYFAIGLKGWVQIRSAAKPPTPHTSESEMIVKEIVDDIWVYWPEDDYEFGHYRPHVVERKLKLKVVVYTGGRVLKTIKKRKFSSLLHISVRENAMVELRPEQFEALL